MLLYCCPKAHAALICPCFFFPNRKKDVSSFQASELQKDPQSIGRLLLDRVGNRTVGMSVQELTFWKRLRIAGLC